LHLFCFSCFSRDPSGEKISAISVISTGVWNIQQATTATHLRLEQDEQCREEDDGNHQPTPQAGATFTPFAAVHRISCARKPRFSFVQRQTKEGAFYIPLQGMVMVATFIFDTQMGLHGGFLSFR
jgi:hypothetical protein